MLNRPVHISLLVLSAFASFPALHAQENFKRVLPDHVEQRDLLFARRVWQVIDLRDVQNRVCMRAGNPLTHIFWQAVMSGTMKAYTSDSLRATVAPRLLQQQLIKRVIEETPVDISSPEITRLDTVHVPFDPEKDIVKLMIMEDWVFDNRRGLQYPRIIAVAPLYRKKILDEDLGLQPVCWLRYNDLYDAETDCRALLKEQMIVDRNNLPTTHSYKEWFEERQFYSYIVKVSNQSDMSIAGSSGFKDHAWEAIRESERLRSELLDYDEGQWEK